MIKKILLAIFFIILFTHAVFAQEVFRVTSVNFDTSNSLIFLTSPDNTTEAILKNVKLTKLSNPKRVYFDINSAILTTTTQNWFLNSGGVKQLKINQFSTNPSKVRIVLYLAENFDASKIKFLKVNNNIAINYKDGLLGVSKEDYFQNTYRDEKSSSSDFYENLSISNEEMEKVKTVVKPPASGDQVLNQIQQAFGVTTPTPNVNVANKTPTPTLTTTVTTTKQPDEIIKELKLKSKYYLNSVCPKPNGFLLSGFGAIGLEKPMYLTNPARVVFDIPNATINSNLKTQEFNIGQDVVKVGQFESNKARIVITSNELEKYFPIFSSDGQSILFVKTETVDIDSLFNKTADAVSYYIKRLSPSSEEFIMAFNAPVVHSIKRDNSKLTINFYNALRYNDKTFRNTIDPSGLSEMKIDLMPKVGLKLTLPLEKNCTVSSYLGADGRSVRVIVKGLKPKVSTYSPERTIVLPKFRNGKRSIVLDAGHGGSDYGAIRAGINEKDINLDVAKRIQAILTSKGVNVAMTRDFDEFVSLEGRTTFCAKVSPDIFVSVHVNSSVKPEICGIETHYYHPESVELAQTVHCDLVSCVRSRDRGLFKSKFYVINHTNVPAILVEIGFISNDSERAELVSEQRKQETAKAIADGILRYLNKK